MTSRENTSDIMNTRLFLLSASWSMVNDVLQAGGPRGSFFTPPPPCFWEFAHAPFQNRVWMHAWLHGTYIIICCSIKIFRFLTNATNILKGFELFKLKEPIRIQEIDVSSFINFRIQENRRESGDMPGSSLDPPLSLRCCKKKSIYIPDSSLTCNYNS